MNRTDEYALARRLVAAATEVLATAHELGASHLPEDVQVAAPRARRADDDPAWEALARQAYRDRRRRDELFDPDLFGEPAWDILLDLFIAARNGKRISITSACIGSAAPSTTALRWLNILERHGLIEREGDARDMRRSYVRLTAPAYARMIDYFGEGSAAPCHRSAAALLNGRGAPRAVAAGTPSPAQPD